MASVGDIFVDEHNRSFTWDGERYMPTPKRVTTYQGVPIMSYSTPMSTDVGDMTIGNLDRAIKYLESTRHPAKVTPDTLILNEAQRLQLDQLVQMQIHGFETPKPKNPGIGKPGHVRGPKEKFFDNVIILGLIAVVMFFINLAIYLAFFS